MQEERRSRSYLFPLLLLIFFTTDPADHAVLENTQELGLSR